MATPPPFTSTPSNTTPPATKSSNPSNPSITTSISIRATSPFPLTASQESEVRDLYYKLVRDQCGPEIKAFATCAAGRTFTIPIVCRTQRKGMEKCMLRFAGREMEDRAREEWFRTLPERQERKEEGERWREDQKRRKKEWWGDYVQEGK